MFYCLYKTNVAIGPKMLYFTNSEIIENNNNNKDGTFKDRNELRLK